MNNSGKGDSKRKLFCFQKLEWDQHRKEAAVAKLLGFKVEFGMSPDQIARIRETAASLPGE